MKGDPSKSFLTVPSCQLHGETRTNVYLFSHRKLVTDSSNNPLKVQLDEPSELRGVTSRRSVGGELLGGTEPLKAM